MHGGEDGGGGTPRTGSTRLRPIALAPGTGGFVLAWVGGLLIARLTGASAVLLVLAALLAAFVCAVLDARRQTRGVEVVAVTAPALVDVGVDTTCAVTLRRRASSRSPVRLRVTSTSTATGPVVGTCTISAGAGNAGDRTRTEHPLTVRFTVPGTIERIGVEVASAGIAGLVWWARRTPVVVPTIHVVPTPHGPILPVESSPTVLVGDGNARRGDVRGEIDGVRPWRDGEAVEAVHWPTTVRSGTLMVHDHTMSSETCWVVTVPPPADAGRLYETLRQGMHAGHEVRVTGRDHADPQRVRTPDDAARIAAVAAGAAVSPPRPSLLHREIHLGRDRDHPEPFARVAGPARWLTALASWLALSMLVGALSGSVSTMLLIAVGLGLGALVTTRFVDDHGDPPLVVRAAVVVASIGALGLVAVESSGITGLLAALRGPLPNLLMMLVVLHGFEASNRRTVRVHLAIVTAVVLYATGLRIDGVLGWWLAAWGVAFVAAVIATATEPAPATPGSARARTRLTFGTRLLPWVALGAGLTLGALAVVPVPRGPASLGLPALSSGAPTDGSGALAGPDGSPPSTRPSSNDRGALGGVGGYRGFTETLDTSVRGGLGDDIVMRVRSPEPAFWRGQTFTDFDGRTWTVSPDVGRPNEGPSIIVVPTLGDNVNPAIPTEELVQTYFLEADLPNVVFAAARPDTVIFDGTLWTRPDGALRSDVTLGEGSAYTVVSHRARVTPDLLRAQGDVAEVFAAIDDPRADELLAPYLAVPTSTTQRTIDLADHLSPPGRSTYDTVLAYQDWLGANTVYDLDAPVPSDRVDAVDDYLFVSQRGFCEQIASALTIMLRTQGVPARLATGYLPGERDRVSGVWKVRASDAHAWVEVWFPDTGWQAFDPTADVPLAGDTAAGTVGHDVAAAAAASVASHPVEVGLAIALAIAAGAAVRWIAASARRRRRGRWGVLQDRFLALAGGHGEECELPATNPRLARAIVSRAAARSDTDGRVAALHADTVVHGLDRAAFDPTWTDRDDDYVTVEQAVRTLELTCS